MNDLPWGEIVTLIIGLIGGWLAKREQVNRKAEHEAAQRTIEKMDAVDADDPAALVRGGVQKPKVED